MMLAPRFERIIARPIKGLSLRTRTKIIIFSFVSALGFWVAVSLIDFAFFSGDAFLDVLIFELSPAEIYMRIIGMVFILIPGIIVATVANSRWKAEEALVKSEQNFRASMDDSPLGIMINRGMGDVVYANQAALDLFGYGDFNEMRNAAFPSRHTPENLVKVQERWKRLEKGNFAHEKNEQEIIRVNGDIRQVEANYKSVLWDGEDRVQITLVDITERKQTEETLRKSEQNFRSSLDDSPLATLINKNIGEPVYANQAMLDLFGYRDFEEMKKADPASRHSSENIVRIDKWWERVHKKKVISERIEHEIVRVDGERRWVDTFIRNVIWDGEEQLQVIEQDITDRKNFEKALRGSESRYHSLLENAPIAITVSTREGEIIEVNKAFLEMTGYESAEEFNSRPLSERYVSLDDREKWLSNVQKSGRALSEEIQLKKKDGTPIWVSLSSIQLPAETQLQQYLVIMQDITERKQAEEALIDDATRRRILVEQSRDGIVVLDIDGNVFESNQQFAEMLGYSHDEILTKSVWDWEFLFPQETVVEMIQTVDEAGDHFETRHRRKDGTEFDVEISTNGAIFGGKKLIFCVCRDISERKQAEEALQKSEQNFRASLEDSPLPCFITGENGKIAYANQAMVDFYGYGDMEKLINTPYTKRYTPEYLAVLEKRWNGGGEPEPTPERTEHDVIRADGEIRSVEAFLNSILWDGEQRGQIIYNDITERRQMEEQIRHSQVLASLGEMTAGIAHEIGNPLASIVLYSEAAIKGVDDRRQTREDLMVIHDEAKRAGVLMKDLLAYSRKLEPDMRRVNVHAVINKVVKMLQYQANVKSINITTELRDGALNVNGDYAQLTQVFMNLILNAEEAVKGQETGNISVSSFSGDGWVKITVADDGPGIPRQNLGKIFMPFFTTKDIGEGTGLGLSTSYGIISAHNGVIKAENNDNGGATFTVQLPKFKSGK